MMLKMVLCYSPFCTITTAARRDKKQSSVRVSFHDSDYFSQQEQLRNGIIQPPYAILEAELKM